MKELKAAHDALGNCARATGDSGNAATQRRPSTVNSRARWHGHPSCVNNACSRCAQRVRNPL